MRKLLTALGLTFMMATPTLAADLEISDWRWSADRHSIKIEGTLENNSNTYSCSHYSLQAAVYADGKYIGNGHSAGTLNSNGMMTFMFLIFDVNTQGIDELSLRPTGECIIK